MKRLTGLTVAAAVLVAAAPAAARSPAVTLELKRDLVHVGDDTRAKGRLTGAGDVSGRRIVLEADDWPFDGAYRKLAAARTGRDGRFAFVVRPGRLRAADGDRARLRRAGDRARARGHRPRLARHLDREALRAQAGAVLEDLADRHQEADGDGADGETLAAEDLALAVVEVGRGGGHGRNLLHPGPAHIGVTP